MKKCILAGVVLALSVSSSWAMPRPATLAVPSLAASTNVIDAILGCPGNWFMVYVMPGLNCKPKFQY